MWFRPSVAQEPKNLHELTPDFPTMDLRLHTNPELHYGVNGAASRSPRPGVSKVPPIQKSTGLRSSCSLTVPSKLKHHLGCQMSTRKSECQHSSTFFWGVNSSRCWLFTAPIGCLGRSEESAVSGVKRSFQWKKLVCQNPVIKLEHVYNKQCADESREICCRHTGNQTWDSHKKLQNTGVCKCFY